MMSQRARDLCLWIITLAAMIYIGNQLLIRGLPSNDAEMAKREYAQQLIQDALKRIEKGE